MLQKEYLSKDESYYLHARQEMLCYIPGNTKYLLDVGCSNGNFGRLVKENLKSIVWGIEPDTKSASHASEYLDHVFNTYFDERINFGNQKFDCIVFNDVLEHLVDPFKALNICKSLLTENGVVVCSIPNIRYFEAMTHLLKEKDFHYVEMGIFDKTHLRFFTKKSMIRMFMEEGYKIKTIEGINSIKNWNKRGYKRFKFLNTLFCNSISDMEFLQYAVVAHL